ncbi:L,D-transpeptidase family protein [Acuticoccus sp. MNP-M23]|uniref:L,D-transpeptidase family protein n=1 Tax=Acuticoccus sp. MNP-M23 TaxID=3072793 RepID=UPI0028150F56|nr:L,D-transpeptidase family protein [Acuticoccus sp. MNP-M23]WMS44988.1 L,D-transpeptidase family protein [Acuticoccus sp. MNP-M23]
MIARWLMKFGGRHFAPLVFAAVLSPGIALAQGNSAEWVDSFDATLPEVAAVNSQQPTLAPEALGRMQMAIQRYRSIEATGGWPLIVPTSRTALQLGSRDDVVEVLRQRLAISGDLTQQGGRSNVYDSYVAAAVKRFQLRHGLPDNGALDQPTIDAMNVPAGVRVRQLEMNLTRISEKSGELSSRYVLVNIPAAEIEAVENGRVRSRHTAVVGKVDRPSPILTSKIHEINFNPYWTVPVSIIRRDLIPKMQKDPSYLADQKIKIYRWGNTDREYDYREIDWNTDEATEYMFRQEPGELNSLGTVKLNFHNQHQVYMHDTPQTSLFGDGARFHSSGCVRVQNVRELITWLLRGNGWDRGQVDAVIRSGQRQDVNVDQPTQVMFAYITAWVNADGVVHFRDDIYSRDGMGTLALR